MNKNSLLNIFNFSPLNVIRKHMSLVSSAADSLEIFFVYVLQENWGEAKNICHNIKKLENKADIIKKNFQQKFTMQILLPISTMDLLNLVLLQDKIANISKNIVIKIIDRKIKFPEHIHQELISYLKKNLVAINLAKDIVNELDDLLESAFGENEIKILQKMISALDYIEKESDAMERKLRHQIFQLEKLMPAIEIMVIY